MNVDRSLLQAALAWLATEGASLFSSWVLEKINAFQKLASEYKLYVSYVVTGLVGVLAYLAMMGMQYVPVPVGYIVWIETLFGVMAVAILGPQIVHRVSRLREKDRIAKALAEIHKCCDECEDCD